MYRMLRKNGRKEMDYGRRWLMTLASHSRAADERDLLTMFVLLLWVGYRWCVIVSVPQ